MLFFAPQNAEEIEAVLNRDLANLYSGLTENSLYLSKKKTEFILDCRALGTVM